MTGRSLITELLAQICQHEVIYDPETVLRSMEEKKNISTREMKLFGR